MQLAALSLPALFGQADVQLRRVDEALGQLQPGALALLSEAALTGYVSPALDFDLRRFAEPRGGPTEQALAALALKHRVALVGPVVERGEDGRCFNGVVGFDAAGHEWLRYHKRHPWYPESWASAGELPWPTATLAGLTFSAAICFDVHFLPAEAAPALARADVLLFPSAWVDDGPGDAKAPLLADLARRFGLTIVNANWDQGVPRFPGQGPGGVWGPDGGRREASLGPWRLADAPEPRRVDAG